MRKGPTSRYYGYLQSLPRQPVSIVALWDEDELFGQDGKKALEKLAGTEMMRETRRMAKEERSKVSFRYSLVEILQIVLTKERFVRMRSERIGK